MRTADHREGIKAVCRTPTRPLHRKVTSAGTTGGRDPDPSKQPITGVHHVHRTIVPILESADAIVYALVGAVFLVAALGMLGYSLGAFPAKLACHRILPLAIVTLVNDLLLVMIIMEVTAHRYFLLAGATGTSICSPFCSSRRFSATRRILAIGAQMNVAGGTLAPDRFREAMIDSLGQMRVRSSRSHSRSTLLLRGIPGTTEISV